MASYSIDKLAKIVFGELYKYKDSVIHHIIIDSRKLFTPENSVFFAIQGERHDGHQFINDLIKKGVRNFVVIELPAPELLDKANFIRVPNTLGALQQLASTHRNQFDYPVIGITGSNGKTIVKEWIYHLLQNSYQIVRSPKSYNSQIGVPLSVWSMEHKYNLGIFEAGISQTGEMQRVQNIIRPDIGIFTNIGQAHQENFKSLKQKIEEKLELFYESETIIYCEDHQKIHKTITEHDILKYKNLLTWSYEGDATLNILSIDKEKTKTVIAAEYKDQWLKIQIPFIDNGSIENAIHAWLLMLHLNMNPEIINKQMENLPAIAMRLEMKKGINHSTIVNDSYNSDLGSRNIALNMLNQQNQHRKKTVILSDIVQTGREASDLYADVADMLQRNQVDRLIGIGESISHFRNLFSLEKYFFSSTEQFISAISFLQFKNEAILLKGSRQFYFEKISQLLEEKVHQTVLEIDLDNVVTNLNYFRNKLKKNTRIMAMVKAFSYGSGTYEIANVLQYQLVDYLGVAFTDEGVTLRESGITLPIVVMNPEPDSYKIMIDYELEPEIYNLNNLQNFNKIVSMIGREEYPIHLKLDTGMNRLGFKEEELPELLEKLPEMNHVRVSSVFSHLAAADETDKDDFTRGQIKLFENMTNQITEILGYPVIRHILNSAGIERFPEGQFEMVRLGIGLYGISALDHNLLSNISTFKSTITQVKQVNTNETIGYGRMGVAEIPKTIGIVPVGYADGLNRALSNGKGVLYVNGNYYPIIGNICMDMCMIDISGSDAKEGDEVIIFGEELPVTELAQKLGTIPYEIFTGISERVKRIYFQE